MNVLLLESNLQRTKAMEKYFIDQLRVRNVYSCHCIRRAIQLAERMDLDIFVLAAHLNDETGIQFVEYLRKTERYAKAWIILFTPGEPGHEKPFEIQDYHYYVLKPYETVEIMNMIGFLQQFVDRKRERSRENLFIRSKGADYSIPTKTIEFIEVNYKCLNVVTSQLTYSFPRYPLKKLRTQLPDTDFFQCHRSYIINKNMVKSVRYHEHTASIDIGEKMIPVGPTYRANMEAELLSR